MRKISILIWILLFVAETAGAQLKELDHYLENLHRSHVIPGFSVVVVKDNKVLFAEGYGKEYSDGTRPMTCQTSSALGSLAKSFTSLAMMQLVEKGLVKLDDPVVQHLPWFRTANKSLSDQITIRMLLNNTSGLKAPVVRNRDISEMAVETLIRSMESVYLSEEPGNSYEYSNDGFALAGLIISELTGMSYEDYLDTYVFKPLEMDRTTNDPADFDDLKVLFGHQPGIDRAIPIHTETEILGEYVAAGSMLRSSANDVGNYLMALLNGGIFRGKHIISEQSITEMWKPCVEFPGISAEDGGNDLPFHYGLGWFMGELDHRQYIFHGGNRRSMSSMTFILPEEKLGVSFIANLDITLIDRYRYPNLITIVNNIVRLSLNEGLSDFAVPVVADPSINEFKLAENEWTNYTGEYILTSGNDWVYLGSRLNISPCSDGLTGTISRGDLLIEEFGLDFITRRTAVSRNITMPGNVQFSFLSDNRTSDVFLNGKRYSRMSEGYYSNFIPASSPGDSLEFYIPRSWSISWNGANFRGFDKRRDGETLMGGVFKTGSSLEEYFKEMFPGNQIKHMGKKLSEISGSRFWEELAIVSSKDEKEYQHLICSSRSGELQYIVVYTSDQNLSAGISNVLANVLNTFTWN